MEPARKPSLITGAIIGALVTLPLLALFALADRVLGLPLLTFDIFDWVGRNTPGGLITAVIDVMVDAIIAFNLGETSSTAKTIEQLMAYGMTLTAGAILGGVLFTMLRETEASRRMTVGIVVGAAAGVILTLISSAVNRTATADPLISAAFIMLVGAGFGALLARFYSDLTRLPEPGNREAELETATATQLDRRRFLVQIGGATATLTVVGAGLNLLLPEEENTSLAMIEQSLAAQADATPEAPPEPIEATYKADFEPAPGTRPEITPLDDHYRIDISARPPVIDAAAWTLAVTGLVNQPQEYMLTQLINDYEPVNRYVTLQCISNRIAGDLISTTRWTGLQLNQLIEEWDLQPEAQYLRITSADGFDEYVSIDMIRNDDRILLAYAWDGQPLKQKHGFPLRIYIPDLYGMKQPKWITDIEVVEDWEEGYWVRRGWSRDAVMRAASVIDTVAVDDITTVDEQPIIPVGGIAIAGARGVSRVEVQVDDGEWAAADLKQPLSETTWVLWRYDWPFTPGDHTFRVRMVELDGTAQIEDVNGVRPDGATGIHSVNRSVETASS